MSSQIFRKVILYSKNGYSERHNEILNRLIDEKILLFCTVGKDCELWHDIMDEIFVGNGKPRDFNQITTWHKDGTLEQVIQFAKDYKIELIDNDQLTIIEI